MEIFVNTIKNYYSDFTGKASRKEFWVFTAFFTVISLALAFITGFIAGITSADAVRYLYLVFVFLVLAPQIAIAVRRLHDTGKSGKLLFIGLIPVVGQILLIIWLCGEAYDGKKKKTAKKK